jgi:hypothetical protein
MQQETFLKAKVWQAAKPYSPIKGLQYIHFINGCVVATDAFLLIKQCLATVHQVPTEVIALLEGHSVAAKDFKKINVKAGNWSFFQDKIMYAGVNKKKETFEVTLNLIKTATILQVPDFEFLFRIHQEKNEVLTKDQKPFIVLETLQRVLGLLVFKADLRLIKMVELKQSYNIQTYCLRPEHQTLVISTK